MPSVIGLKQVAKSAAKKVANRARKISDDIYNARRRYKRALQRELDKDIKNNEKIEGLKELISQSYATKNKEYLFDTKEFERKSYTVTRTYEKEIARNERKNIMFQREINLASSVKMYGPPKISKEKVKIFYAATQNIWQGKPQGQWNKAIMEYYGVTSLEDAWDLVFEDEDVKKALERAEKNQTKSGSDVDYADGTNDERDEKGSPPYIKLLTLAKNRGSNG